MIENLKECVRVLILAEFPRKLFPGEELHVTEYFSENLIDRWIEKLNKPLMILGNQLECITSKFIVVDPLLYKLSREAYR